MKTKTLIKKRQPVYVIPPTRGTGKTFVSKCAKASPDEKAVMTQAMSNLANISTHLKCFKNDILLSDINKLEKTIRMVRIQRQIDKLNLKILIGCEELFK